MTRGQPRARPVDLDADLPDPGEDEQGEVACPRCEGTGWLCYADDWRDQCDRCEGEGTVTGSVES